MTRVFAVRSTCRELNFQKIWKVAKLPRATTLSAGSRVYHLSTPLLWDLPEENHVCREDQDRHNC